MVANPDFVGGEPAMKRVIVRHVVESATQRLLLERGDIDIARNLNPEDVAGLAGNDDVEARLVALQASITEKEERLAAIEGIVPSLFELPEGCRFHQRCRFAQEQCKAQPPQLEEHSKLHSARCFFPLGE